MGFRIWYLIRFPFFLFNQFRYQFLFDLSGNYAPPLILLNANVEKNAWNIPGIPKGVQASWIMPKTLTIHWVHASWMMPKTLILQCGALRSRLISLQTKRAGNGRRSLFLMKRGKTARISERKTRLDAN